MANAEVFDSFFRTADLDKDGRISGQEAVSFFQGAGLPQMTLAKIWQFADQGRTGFLSRVEFYNALKLVTVAQTGREITPELVRAALTGPAAAQIPPPRIDTPALPTSGVGQPTGQPGGPRGASAPVPSSQGGAGQAAKPTQGVYNGQGAAVPGSQASNGRINERQASNQGNGVPVSQGVYGGAPPKQFSPHTNSAPSAPMPQGGYGGPTKQLGPQTSSLSVGGAGVPQLTTQTSSLSRYPPSLGQVQVAPTGFTQQVFARPPAAGSQAARPSLGSLFTTNSAWPPKESTSTGTSQLSSSTSVPAAPSSITTITPSHPRPPTPASGSLPTSFSTSAATTTTTQAPDATAGKDNLAETGFNSGIDLFSSGFKTTPSNRTTSIMAGARSGADILPDSQAAKAASVTPVQPKPSTPMKLEESLFSAPAGAGVQAAVQGRAPGIVPTPQGPPGAGQMVTSAGAGVKPQTGPLMGASWPQMSGNDVQRYARVFTKVDTDKDGKITGEQARELFLSWQLPRGILKQVWDLSDQDNDSMLSFREFCTALYFMERYREGRALPSALPPGIHPDSLQGPPGTGLQGPGGVSSPVWRHVPGASQAMAPTPGTGQALTQPPVQAPPVLQMPERVLPGPGEAAPGAPVREPYKSKVPALDDALVSQLSRDEQEMLKTKHKAAEEADKKVFELDKEIQDYKEKIELYRAKLQEIILFKSRCDNQLNEVKERVASERREMDTLGKKYDQRFKAAGEVSSRLQAEEAAFRDIQEKKMELYTAIAKLEKGGDGKDSIESRANNLSANLDDLKKILNERGRALGVKPKSAVPIEISSGFEGVPDNAMEWVEDWDNFEDEGFTNVRDIMDDLIDEDPSISKSAYSAPWGNGESLFDDGFDFSSDPAIENNVFKTGQDEEPSSFRSGGEGDDIKRIYDNSAEQDLSTSNYQHKDYAFNSSNPSGRYSSAMDFEGESGGDGFNGEATFDSVKESFGQGGTTFDSRDPFGDTGAAWAFNDEDSNGDFRASWGLQGSNSRSTQSSMDVSSSRGQSRFGRERGSIADSLDMDSLRVSSPRGALFDGSIRISSPGGFDNSRRESSPGARGFGGLSSPGWSFDRNGSGHDDYKNAFGSPKTAFDSPKSNAFGSPRNAFGSPKNALGSPRDSKISSIFGNANFDATPSLFGGSPGASKRDDPYPGGSFLRFDSFGPGSPAPARVSGGSEDQGIMSHDGEKSMQRFDSFNSTKNDQGRRRGFSSDDDSDPFGPFGRSGPFGAGAQTAKQSGVWSAF